MKLNNKILYITTVGVLSALSPTNAQTFYQCLPITCKDGQYIDGNTCKNCPAGTFQKGNNKATSCSPCSTGTYSTGGAASCTSCPIGYYCINGVKRECPDGQYQDLVNQGNCKKCTGELYLGYVRYSDSYKYKWLNIDSKISCQKSEFDGDVDTGDQWCCAVPSKNNADRNLCAAPAGYYNKSDIKANCSTNPAEYKKLTMGCDKITGELYVEGCLGRIWAHQTQNRN